MKHKTKKSSKNRSKNRYSFVAAGVIATVVLSVILIAFSVAGGRVTPVTQIPEQTSAAETNETVVTPEAEPVSEEPKPEYYPFASQRLMDAWEENNDVVGWLTVDDCDIDNRVFQSYDNDYYLRRDEDGNYDVWGCYFLDYINLHDENELFDRVSIIYGHSLGDTTESEKFSKLKNFRDKSFAKKHRIIRFDMLNEEHEWEVFAVCNIPVSIDYIDPNPEESKWENTVNYMLEHSFVNFKTDVTFDDHILILSTCTSDDSTRFVVAAKLIG